MDTSRALFSATNFQQNFTVYLSSTLKKYRNMYNIFIIISWSPLMRVIFIIFIFTGTFSITKGKKPLQNKRGVNPLKCNSVSRHDLNKIKPKLFALKLGISQNRKFNSSEGLLISFCLWGDGSILWGIPLVNQTRFLLVLSFMSWLFSTMFVHFLMLI